VSAGDLKLIGRLYIQPSAAMSDILDRGSLLFASLLVLVISLALPVRFYGPLLVLAVIYTPGILLIATWTGGGLQANFRREYAPLLTCIAMAFSAASLPLTAIVWLQPALFLTASGITGLYFVALIFFAVRTVFGTENGTAILITGLSWIPLAAAYLLRGPLQYVLGWLASPFLLFYVFYYLRSEIGGTFGELGAGLRRSQSFRRNLEASAINPHDAEAQYQLGLIYQQRHQFTEAIRRFENAIAIDANETDAHFQLGRIAREQGRLNDALRYFQTVVNQNEGHSRNEILRELGALYIAARQYQFALNELLRYEERRPYDPEGLYYHGQALEGLSKPNEAREAYRKSVEAAALAPAYLRRTAGKWGRLSRKQLQRLT
jgi:tetratricopeptide (TPR) repeat protein